MSPEDEAEIIARLREDDYFSEAEEAAIAEIQFEPLPESRDGSPGHD
ncbi:MAG TPA: hypothetical protein VM493_01265 [Vicinamibacterales bacterium]|nr:hypothetical protein [Vicinamibacterales bacterium]